MEAASLSRDLLSSEPQPGIRGCFLLGFHARFVQSQTLKQALMRPMRPFVLAPLEWIPA